MTLTTLEKDYVNLKPSQKEYFEDLADGCTCCEPIDYFEKVPPEIRDNPELVEVYLNGGTVTKDGVEYELPDRDWSHDVSRANGGSDCADNGRFEDSSTNRSRGATNTTEAEKRTADTASERDADILDDSTVVEEPESLTQSVQDVTEATVWGAGMEVAGGIVDVALDGVMPFVGTAAVAVKTYQHFEKPADKIVFSAATSTLAYSFLASPLGGLCISGFVIWNVGRRGYKLYKKHANKA